MYMYGTWLFFLGYCENEIMAGVADADQTNPVVQTTTDGSQPPDGVMGGRRMGKQRKSYSQETESKVASVFHENGDNLYQASQNMKTFLAYDSQALGFIDPSVCCLTKLVGFNFTYALIPYTLNIEGKIKQIHFCHFMFWAN